MRLVTTHDWSAPVDVDHLAALRAGPIADAPHLVLEVLQYALDEAAAGHVGLIRVVQHLDGSFEVADDGRGTDTRPDEAGVLTVKPVVATPDLRFDDVAAAPLLADGVRRHGLSLVAALSDRVVHENRRRDGVGFRAEYVDGVPQGPPTALADAAGTGTSVRWWPSSAVPAGAVSLDALVAVASQDVEVQVETSLA